MPNSVDAAKPLTLTREQESRLYKFVQASADGDALLYELVAKKIHRVANETANEWEASIVRDWLCAMNELQTAREVVQQTIEPREAPFASVRRGQVGNPNYQAFLDTLEQNELDAITSNVPYFAWFSDRQAEMRKSGVGGLDYLRNWAEQHLSQRVQAIRGLDSTKG